jgi:hypothetical protein
MRGEKKLKRKGEKQMKKKGEGCYGQFTLLSTMHIPEKLFCQTFF